VPRVKEVARGLWRELKNLWAVVGVTLGLVLIVDVVLAARTHEQERKLWRFRLDSEVYKDAAPWVTEHFEELTDYEQTAEWTGFLRVNARGHSGAFNVANGARRTWNPPGIDEGGRAAPRLVLLGGSVAWGYGARDEYTVASWLSRKLHERGMRFVVENRGQIGFTSSEELVQLIQMLASGRPAVVVLLDGVNDILAAATSGVGRPWQDTKTEGEIGISKDRRRLLATLVGTGGIAQSFLARPAPPLSGDLLMQPEELDAMVDPIVERYVTNAMIVQGIARDFGIRIELLLQPTIYNRRHPSPFEQRTIKARGLRRKQVFERVYQKIRDNEVLRASKSFNDLEDCLSSDEDPAFIDPLHPGERANGLIAEAILGILAER
jgi:lysophospholipase L1-like esterase